MEENFNILSGDLNCLKEYKSLLEQYNQLKTENSELNAEEAKLEKELSQSRKNLKDEIDSTVKKRRGEIASRYNSEISKSEDKLKKAKSKREKAKEKGVKERIAEETTELVNQNKEINKAIRTTLREEKIPKICGTNWFYTFFFTKGAGEVFQCGLAIVILFLILPGAVYLALPFEKLSHKFQIPAVALTYFVIMVCLFLLIKLIGDKTKHKYTETLKGIREQKDSLKSNKKQIARIAKAIKHDEDEGMYGLENFDEQIGQYDAELQQIISEKESALEKFDQVSSKEISGEIERKEMPKINELEAKYNEVCANHNQYEEQVKNLGLKLSNEYEVYIGTDFQDTVKLDGLLNIMETGGATTVSEAINVYKSMS